MPLALILSCDILCASIPTINSFLLCIASLRLRSAPWAYHLIIFPMRTDGEYATLFAFHISIVVMYAVCWHLQPAERARS